MGDGTAASTAAGASAGAVALPAGGLAAATVAERQGSHCARVRGERPSSTSSEQRHPAAAGPAAATVAWQERSARSVRAAGESQFARWDGRSWLSA